MCLERRLAPNNDEFHIAHEYLSKRTIGDVQIIYKLMMDKYTVDTFPRWIKETLANYGVNSLIVPDGLLFQCTQPSSRKLAISIDDKYDTYQAWYAYLLHDELRFKVVNILLEKS